MRKSSCCVVFSFFSKRCQTKRFSWTARKIWKSSRDSWRRATFPNVMRCIWNSWKTCSFLVVVHHRLNENKCSKKNVSFMWDHVGKIQTIFFQLQWLPTRRRHPGPHSEVRYLDPKKHTLNTSSGTKVPRKVQDGNSPQFLINLWPYAPRTSRYMSYHGFAGFRACKCAKKLDRCRMLQSLWTRLVQELYNCYLFQDYPRGN